MKFPIPLALITLNTAPQTINRLKDFEKTWANHSLIRKGVFILREVVAMPTPDKYRVYPDIVVVGGDPNDRDLMTLRVTTLFDKVVMDYRHIPWVYNADDDTWIDLDNLFIYLINLMSFLNPMKHLVFKAHANHQMGKRSFVHGGSGWLMSRGWMEFCHRHNYTLINFNQWARYRQPDTAQSIIVRNLITEEKYWDEFYFPGFEYKYCPEDKTTAGDFSEIKPCTNDRLYGRLNDIITFHTIGLKRCNWQLAIKIRKTLPDWLLFWRNDSFQEIQLCHSTGNEKIASVSLQSLKERTPVLLPKDMPAIDFSSLVDENVIMD